MTSLRVDWFKLSKKIFAFFVGLFFLLLIIEMGLSILGHLYSDKSSSSAAPPENTFNILCLGNSHTFGAGVNKNEAYPAVIESFLNSAYDKNQFHVVNGGIINGNTAIIIENMKYFTEVNKPNLVLLMIGQPNIWNNYGFKSPATDESKEMSLKERISQKVEKLHILRLYELVNNILFKKNFDISYDEKNEALQLIAKREGGALNLNISPDELHRLQKIISKYISNFNESSPKNLNAAILTKILIEEYLHTPKRELIPEIKQLIAYEKNNYSFNTLRFFIAEKYAHAANVKYQELIQQVLTTQNLEKFEVLTELIEKRNSKLPYDIQLKYLENELAVYPANTMAADAAYSLLYGSQNYDDAARMIIASLEANPYSVKDISGWLRQLHNTSASSQKIIDEFIKSYPYVNNLVQFENEMNDTQMRLQWIERDYQKIIDYYTQQKIPVVIIGYHWLRTLPYEKDLELTIAKIAQNNPQIPYINLKPVFLSEIAFSKKLESRLYATAMGPQDSHPSIEGHKLIAKLLIDFALDKKLIPENSKGLQTDLLYQLHKK